jgi:hypothetical protein
MRRMSSLRCLSRGSGLLTHENGETAHHDPNKLIGTQPVIKVPGPILGSWQTISLGRSTDVITMVRIWYP